MNIFEFKNNEDSNNTNSNAKKNILLFWIELNKAFKVAKQELKVNVSFRRQKLISEKEFHLKN